jgi:HSP20 family protein
MAITPYRPTTDLFRSIFDDLPAFGTGWGGRLAGMDLLRAPSADVMESKDEIHVTIELPGLSADEVEVSLEDNVLTIGGEKREERTEQNEENRWHLSERRYGRFSRSFVLPKEVEQDRIHASFDNGVLNVVIPKSEKVKPRRIDVRGGHDSQRIETKANE